MIPIDLKGKIFKRLTVIRYDNRSLGSGHARWICKCSCGKTKSIRANHLKSGDVRSCGCFAIDVSQSKSKRELMKILQKGDKNSNWKGDKAKYSTIHSWLSNKFKSKKKICQFCKKKKKLDFALKKGKKHSRSINGYFLLCRSCHIKYDR